MERGTDMRKILAALLALLLLLSAFPLALASGETWYVNNPNPSDRLNLRVGTDENEYSLGKYYNGVKVTVLEKTNDLWYEVKVGNDPGAQIGYMLSTYLTSELPSDYVNRMPVYVSTRKWTAYHQPDKASQTETFAKGMRVYVMGEANGWRHVLVRLKGEGDYACFVPSDEPALTASLVAYVSNPDKADRLHLREKPEQNGQSLGKYYNGTQGTVLGQSMDLNWCYVDVYGRTGFMKSQFLCFHGEINNTYYGVVSTNVVQDDATLYATPSKSGKQLVALHNGEALDVYGVLDGWLHVQVFHGSMGFVKQSDTGYTDPRN